MEENSKKSEEKEILEEKKEDTVENKINDTKEVKQEESNIQELKEQKEIIENNLKEERDSESNKQKVQKNKSHKKLFIIISIIIVFLIFLSTIFAILNMNNDKVLEGVFIEKIEVSNLTQEEINNKINENVKKIEEIELQYNDYNTIIKLEDIGLEINAKDAINTAILTGKSNNIIIDNYSILRTKIFKTKVGLDIKIDEEKLDEVVNNIQAEIPEAVKPYFYEIKGEKLIITNGKSGIEINKKEFKNQIIENIKEQFNQNVQVIKISTEEAIPEKINIEKIHSEIYKDAKDAYIVDEPFELHKEEEGIDFKISTEDVKKLLEEEKETYEIPLKITKPKVAVKDLGEKLFKQNLSKYTTIYDSSNTNRASNIALAAKTINGTILLPGETFSYNGKLGNTTKEKGYKPGGAYVGGKVVQSYGGGICQVSSTLYNAVLYANLGIVERYNHSYAVSYVPAGRDATVAYGGKDFKFKNTRKYPVKIIANAKNGVVSISIKGIKEEKEYDIELTSTVLSSTPFTVTYEKNTELEEGKEKVIQKGFNGKKSIAYKIVKLNGKTISKTVLSKDTYKPMNKIVEVGTKKVEEQVIPITSEVPVTPTDINNNVIQ